MKKMLLLFVLLLSSCCHKANHRPLRPAENYLETDFSTVSFWLFVRHDRSLNDLIREAQFDFAVDVIPERVWTSGANPARGRMEAGKFKLIRYGNLPGASGADTIRRALEQSGCRAADVWDLLAFATEHPEAQRWVRVAALSTHYGLHVSTIQERYFYLGGDARARTLSLWEDSAGWNLPEYNWHFLATCAN